MKFYNREKELAFLNRVEKDSHSNAQMTILIGRRRVGKTTLLRKGYEDGLVLYLFVAKKNEVLLCDEFVNETEKIFEEPLGSFTLFAEFFRTLIIKSKKQQFTLIIDEFQEFQSVNPAIFSDMQNIWDTHKNDSKLNLIICGSVYSMMRRIFENAKEPLFGRVTAKLVLKSFDIKTIKQILGDFNPSFSKEDLLAFYMITGGVPKYIEQLVMKSAFTKKTILDAVFSEGSSFLVEGRDVLIDEFGKDYGNYFSILSLIASSRNDRGEMESILNMAVGGYLAKLENDYDIIRRVKPFMAKEGSRNNKYRIDDVFLNFWFRFIFTHRSAIEIGNLDYVREVVERDYETYSGIVLEQYFRQVFIESKKYNVVAGYWDRKGKNEIDIVAVNDMEQKLAFCEVKRNKKRISKELLKQKAERVASQFPDYAIDYIGLSLEDM